MKKKKIGLALGGGGARGLAHLGVLQILLREGLRPDRIVGSSIGAVIGALYAVMPDHDAVVARVREYFDCECFKRTKFDFLKETEADTANDGLFDSLSRFLRKSILLTISLARQSLVSVEDYMDNIAVLVNDIDIQDTEIPLAVVCTDIHAGEEVVITEGPMRSAVAASAAIPGMLPPIDHDGRLLLDGGWVDQIPARPCRELGADIVIAVDVAREMEQDYALDTGLDVLRRANAVTRSILSSHQRQEADVVISPEVGDMNWASFDCVDICLKRGAAAAESALPAIRRLL